MFAKILPCAVILAISISITSAANFFHGRIVGGFNATWGQVPWTASIRYIPTDGVFGKGHHCGGSLIGSRTILTAAHCLFDHNERLISPSNFKIVGGNLDRTWSNSSTFIGRVSRTTPHNRYSAETLENDIGVIILQDAVPANHPFFKVIPLATSDTATNTSCVISGWGDLKYNGLPPNQLQMAHVLLYDRNICRAAYESLPVNSVCAGVYGGGIDSCQGDSGGALVCNGRQVGVVSCGEECGLPHFPGIYTDVSKFSAWIAANDSPAINRLSGLMTVLISAAVVALRS